MGCTVKFRSYGGRIRADTLHCVFCIPDFWANGAAWLRQQDVRLGKVTRPRPHDDVRLKTRTSPRNPSTLRTLLQAAEPPATTMRQSSLLG